MDDNRRQKIQHNLKNLNINLQEEDEDEEDLEVLLQIKKKKTRRLPQKLNQKIVEKLRLNEEQKILEAYEKHLEEKQNVLRLMDLENQEDLFYTFDNNFYNNKSFFEQIWFQQDHNLKICLNNIYKKFLQPKGINLSETEKKILLSKLNTLVIGRSGTGKTTSALLKISAMDMCFKKYQEKDLQQLMPIQKLRICFTTISDYLKQDVHTTFRSITNQNQNAQNHEAHCLQHVKSWPLFSTIRNLINMIDGNLAIPFLKRDTNGRILQDLGYQNNNYIRSKIKGGSEYYQEIGIQQFIHEFWQEHKQLVEALNVDYYTVYSQINSYITGHIKSFLSDNGMISLEQYINTVGRTKNCLNNEQKVSIYKICQMYQKWKISKQYFDLNDQVIYILQQIFEKNYFSEEGFFHYIFIDEVQDLNCLIIYLLTILTEQNIFMGGDTAQTISQEIAFRFTELKAFFQKKFMIEDLACTLVLQQQLVEEQLLKNFRCHEQITAINNSLIKLLELLFPTSIDILAHEISEKQGPKPLLIHDFDNLKKFLFQDIKLSEKDQKDDSNVQKSFQFGICDRLQAFIVKNDQEKDKLQKLFDQDVQLSMFQVYTIFESKGLEFQDIITYNLLNTSLKATGCWAVLNYLTENFEKTSQLEFHIQKVYGKEFPKLIPEIKNLYVAFSRARSRIFIFEDLDGEQKIFKNPISKFLEKHHLIEEKITSKEQQKLIMECHKSYIVYNEPKIDPDQFIQQAKILFEKKQYKYAGDFFKRIGDQSNFYLCQAKILADNANNIIVQNRQKYESEKQLYLKQRSICENQIQIYKKVKKIFKDSLYYLEKIDDFKTISQIQFTLGEYEQAIEASKNRILQIQQNKEINLEEKEVIIREIRRDIKIFYLNLLLILEEKFESTKKDIQFQKNKAVYKELDTFLATFPLIDIELVIFTQYHSQDFNSVYNSLVETQFVFDDQQLKKNINYYYPSLLQNELNVYKHFYEPQRIIERQENANFLTNQIKKFIQPFYEIFQSIIVARMSKEYLENLSKEFNQIINNYNLENISSQQLLIYFIISGHYNQYEIQLLLSRYFNNQKLQQLSITNFVFQNHKDSEKINNFLDKVVNDYQIFEKNQQYSQNLNLKHLSFLRLHNKLIERKINPYSDRFLVSLNYLTNEYSKKIIYQNLNYFQIFVNSKYKNFEILKEKIYDCCSDSENLNYKKIYDYVLMSENLKKIRKNSDNKALKIPQYQKNFNYSLQQFKLIKEQRYIAKSKIKEIKYKCFKKYEQKDFIDIFLSSVEELSEIMTNKSAINSTFIVFFEYQKLLFKYYYGMKIISFTSCFIDFNPQQIEKITRVASLIINYNTQVQSQTFFGEDNKLFIDALCSIFGYFCPNSSRFETQVDNQINIWDDYNISNFYFVNSKSEFYEQDLQIIDLFAFYPIISDDSIQAVYRQKVILLCKKRIAEVVKDFVICYSKYLIYKIKQRSIIKNYEEDLKQLNQSIQILYLENELKIIMQSQFSYLIDKQIKLFQKQNQLNDDVQHEEAFNFFFKKIFQINNNKLKQIIIKNGICLQLNKNMQYTIQVGEQNKLDTFFVQNFLVILKKLRDQIQEINVENQGNKPLIQKDNQVLQSINKIQNIQYSHEEQQSLSQEQQNQIDCEIQKYNIRQDQSSKNIEELNQQQDLRGRQCQDEDQNLGSYNYDDDGHDEILEEDIENDEFEEDLQNGIQINTRIQKKKEDLHAQNLEEFLQIFSMMQIRQLSCSIPFILEKIDKMKIEIDSYFVQIIFEFFQSKQENNMIQTSINSLKIIEYIKDKSQNITYLLLLTGLNEFIKYITNKNIQYIDILEQQVEYFDIEEKRIIINKKKNTQGNYDINIELCLEVEQIIEEQMKIFNGDQDQNNQFIYDNQKANQRYDFIGYIHQKLTDKTQIQRLCDLIYEDSTFQDLIIKVIKILQKSRKQILNKISQDKINSSEQFMLILERLEALGNQEKVLVAKIEEFLNEKTFKIDNQQLISLLQNQISLFEQIFEEFKIDQTQKINLDILDSVTFIKQQLINLN
ncbi:hypothetical protein ABPG72_001719 [Tetrahymena utriculariae]